MATLNARDPVLFVGNGGGSMLAEIVLSLANVRCQVGIVAWGDNGLESEGLHAANPLGQVPTLVFPNGQVLTETAAIVLSIHDSRPDLGLVPSMDSGLRPQFWRWLMVINAAIYPTFTYGDYPQKWADQDNEGPLRTRTDQHRKRLMLELEQQVSHPWFLGETFSALDLYVWVLIHWRPRPDWYQAHAPKLYAIAKRVDDMAETKRVIARNGVKPLP
jgi:GST-like protein